MASAVARARELCDESLDWEAVMSVLRGEGFSKTDCIRATIEAHKVSLGEAKRLVHESKTWSDLRESDNCLIDKIVDDAVEMGGTASLPESP